MEGAINVRHAERWASALGGAALVWWGVKRVASHNRPLGTLVASAGAALMWRAGTEGTRPRLAGSGGYRLAETVSINRSPSDLYTFWRNLERLPEVISQLRSVRELDGRRSHWVANGPARWRPEWTAEIIHDIPDALIAWRTIGDADVASAGSVQFEAGSPGRGTTVRVRLQDDTPAGKLGPAAARLFGEAPEQALREGLRRFKQLMETGELATTAGQPRGSR